MTTTRTQLLEAAAAATREERRLTVNIPGVQYPIKWDPELALAALGHMAQHWPSYVQEIAVEGGTPGAGAAILTGAHGDRGPLRIRVGLGEAPGTAAVRELCGHPGCDNTAPAQAGTRCWEHFQDPAPAGETATYWAEQALTAWAEVHAAPTGEAASYADTVRRSLIHAARAAGMSKNRIHVVTGVARSTIDRIIDPPAPAAEADDDYDNTPA